MKKCLELLVMIAIIAVLAALLLAGCASPYTITEYDTAGNRIKVTEGKESAIKSVTEATKDKTLIVWKSGWAAYVSASMATVDDPTPTGKIYCGKVDGGYISIKPGDEKKIDWNGVAKVVAATSKSLSVSASGVSETPSAEPDTGRQ